MHLLLSEGSGVTSRQVAHRLHQLGHRVDILSSDDLAITRFTKATERLHAVPTYGPDPLAWLDAALDVWARGTHDALIPTHEQVAVLAAFPARLRDAGVRTAVPSFAAIESVQDKLSARATLARIGVPQPESAVITATGDLAAWTRFPAFVKLPIGTASGGVWRIVDGVSAGRVAFKPAVAEAIEHDGGVLVQQPADGPLAMVQSVFDDGHLVAFHANLRARLGARGGASHKTAIAAPEAREVIEALGSALRWHGGLSADVVLTASGPSVIDVNPRLVEPNNAWRAGVDLVGALLGVIDGAHPARQPDGAPGARTHQLLLAVIGAAEQRRGRRGVAAELVAAVRRRGDYAGSTEEMLPLRGDWRAAIPLVGVSAALLARPRWWSKVSSGSVDRYALTPAGWRAVRAAAEG